jgi:small-conductance mechanosensitive channel
VPGESHFLDIARVIQLAVAPVFLLTAIGTILNVLIARLARAVDRRRTLEEHLPDYVNDRRAHAERELGMLHRRIVLVIWSTALAVLAALFVCLLIGTAFAGAFIATDLSRPVAGLFIAAVVALTACLLVFLREISIAAVSARQTLSPQAPRPERRKATAEAK